VTWNISACASRFAWLLPAGLALLAATAAAAPDSHANAGATPAPTRFAHVWRISGTLTASPAQALDAAAPRRLKAGDALYVGERIEAAADGQAVLQTLDAGYIAVRPGAGFAMEQFVAEQSADDRFALRLLQGGLRLVTGWVARLHPGAYRIITPTATVGVRGTDHETYFLDEALGRRLAQAPGTYDKVNRGATALQNSAGSVDIAPGKVGFARLASPRKTRALGTLVLPVLLEQVPGFYLDGAFDAELDALSLLPPGQQDSLAPPQPHGAAPPPPAAREEAQAVGPSPTPPRLKNGQCNAQAVARDWLEMLDSALVRRDAAAVLALFAPTATVSATVRTSDGGMSTLQLSREAFAASSSAALDGLSQFSQRRLSVSASALRPGHCEQLSLRSEVSEQGVQNGKPYALRSSESYLLELRHGQWLAQQASMRQR
jgi:hypothetical protein